MFTIQFFQFFRCLNFLIINVKKPYILSYCAARKTLQVGEEGSSRKFLNLKEKMQMHVDPGTRSPPDPLPPHELFSLHLPQGLGVQPSSTHLPLGHSATKRPSSRSLSRGPWTTALVLNIRMLPLARSPPGLAMPPFPTPTCHQLSYLYH